MSTARDEYLSEMAERIGAVVFTHDPVEFIDYGDAGVVLPAGSRGEFSIGGDLWPGLSKVIEEAGEVAQLLPEVAVAKALGRLQQTAGKLIGSEGRLDHWSGDLGTRIVEEIGDLRAALKFFVLKNGLDDAAIARREDGKFFTFLAWHYEALEKRGAVA